MGIVAGASDPIPSSLPVEERLHEIEFDVTPEGATVVVTRSLFNPGPLNTQIGLPIPVPCTAALDQVEVQARDAAGGLIWRPAELLGASEASARWQAWIDGPSGGSETFVDADTAVHVRRNGWGCAAMLEIYPIPPLRSRTVSYRVFVPSTHDLGRYVIELPVLSAHGRATTLELDAPKDPAFTLSVDGQVIGSSGVSLDSDRAHLLEFTPRDPGRGHVRAVDLDLSALVASAPAALAALPAGVDVGELPRVLLSDFEVPSELAQLPPVSELEVAMNEARRLLERPSEAGSLRLHDRALRVRDHGSRDRRRRQPEPVPRAPNLGPGHQPDPIERTQADHDRLRRWGADWPRVPQPWRPSPVNRPLTPLN